MRSLIDSDLFGPVRTVLFAWVSAGAIHLSIFGL